MINSPAMNMRLIKLGLSGALRLAKTKVKSHAADDFKMSLWERKRLDYLPRYQRSLTPLLGKQIELTDGTWYVFSFREIFRDRIYQFEAETEAPLIIDCGANIGLSVIFFKHLYPQATVLAFEADPEIFGVLERNIRTFELDDVTLSSKAVWTTETEMRFEPEGCMGGRLIPDGELGYELIPVQTARLRDYLTRHVDFLKLDIEGAEYEVIKDCQDRLNNVGHLFLEYHGSAGQPQTLQEILAIIQSAGFRYHIQDANPIKHPFIERERRKGYDLQLNVFAFRQ